MMGGKSSQRKGRAGELEFVGILQARGYPVERGGSLTFGGVPDLTGLPGIHIECKRVEGLNLCAALRHAKEDSQYFDDGLPTVFHRRSREGWLCTMALDDWLQFYQASNPPETARNKKRRCPKISKKLQLKKNVDTAPSPE